VTGGHPRHDRMLTSDPDIYAIGDAVEVTNPVTGHARLHPLAGPRTPGRIAADQIAGGFPLSRNVGAIDLQVFDWCRHRGRDEKVLKKNGTVYQKGICIRENHASFIPERSRSRSKFFLIPSTETPSGPGRWGEA